MRRSRKETVMLEPGNRLLHNDTHESAGMMHSFFAAEAAEEWATGHVQGKHPSRKPPRA
ncbi:hypothetical protein [Paenibacillus oceani]|uniref:Uncharacterized protein n=1 Tax=Paenibacillus oceani TaxID=2772510 RepID=A0A927GXZ2_9BACL|nr:hypothetical protein [Paenibacillus oceani]MBD2861050.1 hypothetical protein [Paenibacillus oceani]